MGALLVFLDSREAEFKKDSLFTSTGVTCSRRIRHLRTFWTRSHAHHVHLSGRTSQ